MSLDKAFKSGATTVRLSPTSGKEQVMAVTEMIASGHIRTVAKLPPINSTIGDPWPRLSVWGFIEITGYETKKMDKELLFWPIDIAPTERYVYGNPLEQIIADTPAPTTTPEDTDSLLARIPTWRDFGGGLKRDSWASLLLVVTQTTAFRAGISVAALRDLLERALDEWEIRLLLDWLERVGAVRRLGDAYFAGEWWWLVVPTVCAGFAGDGEEEL